MPLRHAIAYSDLRSTSFPQFLHLETAQRSHGRAETKKIPRVGSFIADSLGRAITPNSNLREFIWSSCATAVLVPFGKVQISLHVSVLILYPRNFSQSWLSSNLLLSDSIDLLLNADATLAITIPNEPPLR
ncbi:hypothetical protein GALMADRAFT_144672 [Galerina marginata CBS 339.88]|uniref:Uncharacterized protein n=1 Tax=Galerina marginata (strain CBS 339.88) TaxID=685588 RepID=A0A067SRP4_GALM3|nr:hypothetical protein GALMADRAFT_144672 [Galerina marginata CBS 339.88]